MIGTSELPADNRTTLAPVRGGGDVIRKQFIRDLASPDISDIDQLKWVFKKTNGITDDILKANVINVLKSSTVELTASLDESIVKKLFPADNLITATNYAERLVKNLEKTENFTKIFRVVD